MGRRRGWPRRRRHRRFGKNGKSKRGALWKTAVGILPPRSNSSRDQRECVLIPPASPGEGASHFYPSDDERKKATIGNFEYDQVCGRIFDPAASGQLTDRLGISYFRSLYLEQASVEQIYPLSRSAHARLGWDMCRTCSSFREPHQRSFSTAAIVLKPPVNGGALVTRQTRPVATDELRVVVFPRVQSNGSRRHPVAKQMPH